MEIHREYLLRSSHTSPLTEPQQKASNLLDNFRIPTRLYPVNVDEKSNVPPVQHKLCHFAKDEVQIHSQIVSNILC